MRQPETRGCVGRIGIACLLLLPTVSSTPAAVPSTQKSIEGTWAATYWETCQTYALGLCLGGLLSYDPWTIVAGRIDTTATTGPIPATWICPGSNFDIDQIRIDENGTVLVYGETNEPIRRKVNGGQILLSNTSTGALTTTSYIDLREPDSGTTTRLSIVAGGTPCGFAAPTSLGVAGAVANAIHETGNQIAFVWMNPSGAGGMAFLARIGSDESGPNSGPGGEFLSVSE